MNNLIMREFCWLLVLLSSAAFGQTAFDVNKQLGRGVNMGNMFEAPAEDAWGNPYRSDYFQRIAALGFDHVRIPITWDVPSRALQSAPYTLEAAFLQRIRQVVDHARSAGLMVIINMHHHDSLFEAPEASKSRFLSQWTQIATHFKDYDSHLLFEVLNEPHGNLTPQKWNVFFRDALAVIRETNPTRVVVLGVAEYGGLGGLPKLEIPDDNRLILSIHYYEPFDFTHQGAEWAEGSDQWLGTQWENTDREQEIVKNQFQYAKSLAIPIHIGEFGAYHKADLPSRVRWTTFLARWFEEQGFSWAYWEFSAGFGFFNPQTNEMNEALVNALLHDPLPEPVKTITETVYQSDFSRNIDGWSLQVNEGAEATLTRSGNSLKIQLNKNSAEGWHVQLTRGNVSLKKGRRYLVTFEAEAAAPMNFSAYTGMARAPWNSYSGFFSFSGEPLQKTFDYLFLMNDNDDPAARLVFDVGHGNTLTLHSIRIAEIRAPHEVALGKTPETVTLYPNPGREQVNISGITEGARVELINLKGEIIRTLRDEELRAGIFSVKGLSPGHYFLRFNDQTARLVIP